jgi:class 3 adenylate cyclase/pimeloyl-ACP methyl ester carboxylesterase
VVLVNEVAAQYVKCRDGASFVYETFGEGSLDLLVLDGITVPIDLLWDDPGLARFRDRLGTFSRNIWIELRGWGSSDRDIDVKTSLAEAIVDEQLSAVLDACGCERVALVGCTAQGPLAIRYAVAHPDRVSALILVDSFASYVRDEECPWGIPARALDNVERAVEHCWGTGSMVETMAPSRGADTRFRAWMARGQRLGSGARSARERIRERMQQDVRELLPRVNVPTLVLHRRDDRFIRVEAGRYLAERIADATYVELPGSDSYFFVGDADAVLDEIEEFLTGCRTGAEGGVVSTVLFTDIDDSTRHEASLGRRAWSRVIAEHDALVRTELFRHRGNEIKTLGDGFLATFDSAGGAIRCASRIVSSAHELGVAVRAGIHTGEIEFRDRDITGLAVTIGKRVCDLAPPGHVLVTDAVRGVTVGSNVELETAGDHTLKGVPGTWHLHAVRPRDVHGAGRTSNNAHGEP